MRLGVVKWATFEAGADVMSHNCVHDARANAVSTCRAGILGLARLNRFLLVLYVCLEANVASQNIVKLTLLDQQPRADASTTPSSPAEHLQATD